MDGVLIRYPLGIPLELIVDLSEHFNVYILCAPALEVEARDLLADAGVELERVYFLEAVTDSYWTRDYGPWCRLKCLRNNLESAETIYQLQLFPNMYISGHRILRGPDICDLFVCGLEQVDGGRQAQVDCDWYWWLHL